MRALNYAQAIREAHAQILETDTRAFVIGQGLWSPWYAGASLEGLDRGSLAVGDPAGCSSGCKARLAAGVAADVGDGAGWSALEQLLAQSGRIEASALVGRGRRRRGPPSG